MVAEAAPVVWVHFLRDQTGLAGEVEVAAEQVLGLFDVALFAGEAVFVLIAVNGVAGAQPGLHGFHGGPETGIAGIEEPEEADGQHRGVEVGAVVGGRERADLIVLSVGQDVLLDLIAQHDPFRAFAAEQVLGDVDRAVDGDLAHHLGVGVVAGSGAHFPDALVGLHPALVDGADQVFDEAPPMNSGRLVVAAARIAPVGP